MQIAQGGGAGAVRSYEMTPEEARKQFGVTADSLLSEQREEIIDALERAWMQGRQDAARECAEIAQAGVIRWPEAAEAIRCEIEQRFGLEVRG